MLVEIANHKVSVEQVEERLSGLLLFSNTHLETTPPLLILITMHCVSQSLKVCQLSDWMGAVSYSEKGHSKVAWIKLQFCCHLINQKEIVQIVVVNVKYLIFTWHWKMHSKLSL